MRIFILLRMIFCEYLFRVRASDRNVHLPDWLADSWRPVERRATVLPRQNISITSISRQQSPPATSYKLLELIVTCRQTFPTRLTILTRKTQIVARRHLNPLRSWPPLPTPRTAIIRMPFAVHASPTSLPASTSPSRPVMTTRTTRRPLSRSIPTRSPTTLLSYAPCSRTKTRRDASGCISRWRMLSTTRSIPRSRL